MLRKLLAKKFHLAMPVIVAICLTFSARAQGEGTTGDEALFVVNNTWMLVSTFLVFIMHLGFATLESGLTRQKNTVNILFKNLFIISVGLITKRCACAPAKPAMAPSNPDRHFTFVRRASTTRRAPPLSPTTPRQGLYNGRSKT